MRIVLGAGYAPLTTAALNLIAHGDSWTAGFFANDPMATNGFVGVCAATLGIPILNSGVGSQTVSNQGSNNNMIFTAPTAVDAHLDPTKLNVIFAQEAINEISGNGGSASELQTARATYYTARKAAAAAIGAKVHICWVTQPPAFIGVSPDFSGQGSINALNAAMITSNAALLTSPQGIADSVVDFASISQFILPNFVQASFIASGVYSSVDYVHPNNGGHALLGAFLAANNRVWRRRVH